MPYGSSNQHERLSASHERGQTVADRRSVDNAHFDGKVDCSVWQFRQKRIVKRIRCSEDLLLMLDVHHKVSESIRITDYDVVLQEIPVNVSSILTRLSYEAYVVVLQVDGYHRTWCRLLYEV